MAHSFAFEPPGTPREKSTPAAVQKSHAKPFDPYRFKAMFPNHWAGFLRAHFRNPEHVAFAFDVTYQTAHNWWDGLHQPSGPKVALAAVTMPRRFAAAFGVAA